MQFVYDLFLCDFPMSSQKVRMVKSSIEGDVNGTHRAISLLRDKKVPKINPMLDLARFFAYMLIKIPLNQPQKMR